jgi:ATP-dependent exoDNAse (exonuclease V) beta subunit
MLAQQFAHARDKNITFQEEGHIYTITGNKDHPISVTTLIHKFFPVFDADLVIDKMMKSNNWVTSKYFGKTKEEIKSTWEKDGQSAALLGTKMHADIEHFLNKENTFYHDSIEFKYFLTFWRDFTSVNKGFYPYRTEWLIYDEGKNLAGSIDCVLCNSDNQYVILDWKRSKEIKLNNNFEHGLEPFTNLQHCNYNHYTLQLNIYRHVLETKYNKNVIAMYIVVFHPNNKNYLVYNIEKYNLSPVWDKLFV